jgi:hypothetical protein
MRILLACTCLTPVALILTSGTAAAQRTINTATTAPVSTATATNNAPDNVSITSAGSIKLTGGSAVTVNSSNNVSNAGTLEVKNANGSNGILIQPGLSGNITNSGTISLLEDFTPADADKDGDLDGPFAQGGNRFGIRLAPGGTFTGAVTNANRIEVEGNQSGGIALDSILAGSLTNSGSIAVTGNDSQGIRAGAITGNVRIAGSVAVQGQNSVGVALDGNIGGTLVFQGAISATGYRYPTPPADVSKLDADDLLQGGPAVRISGDVGGGIVFAVPPPNNSTTDDDEDKDGIKDAEEGSSAISVAGAAPAILIASASQDLVIGAAAGHPQGHGLVVNGTVSGSGVYAGVDGNGIVIGGLGKGVAIAGGMSIGGTVSAASNGANATAVRIGSGASVPEIRVSGTVRGNGGGDVGDLSRGIQIDQGASVTAIRNVGGTIEANAAKDGSATAIHDASGGVATLVNQGTISAASGSTAGGAGPIAINLAANQSGVTLTQSRLAGASTPIPKIVGDVRLGSGNDLFEIGAGSVTGRTSFGAGADRLTLSGDAAYAGAVDFGSGNDQLVLGGASVLTGAVDFGAGTGRLEIGGTARFQAALTGGAGVDVVVNGGTFHATQQTPVALASLAIGNNSVLGVDIGGAPGAATRYDVAGAASFGSGSKLRVRIVDLTNATGRHLVVDAGSLSVAQPIAFDSATLPFLFNGAVETNLAAGEVAVTIARKTAAQLDLNQSATSAYDAVYAALVRDSKVAGVFLNLTSGGAVRDQIAQMLPDHAGGTFETVTLGSRTTARFLADPSPTGAEVGEGWRLWLQQAGFGTSKDLGDTAAYGVSGWSAVVGAERDTGIGSIGGSIAYLTGSDANGSNDNHVETEHYELAAHWRGRWGGLAAFLRGSAGVVSFDSTRFFTGIGQDGQAVSRTTNGSWEGHVYSLAGGMSYDLRMSRFTLRPSLTLDYYRLSEDGYAEDGGGDGLDLIVEERTSDELAGTLALAAGYEFARGGSQELWLRGEVEGGRRQILAGELGSTRARFEGGNLFTLAPEERSDGWTGALRLIGGQGGTTVGAEVRAEEQSGHASVSGRVSLGIAF